MYALEDVCRAIQARAEHAGRLEKAVEASRMLPWHRFAERSFWKREIASSQDQVARCDKQIRLKDVLRLADMAGVRLWHRAAETVIPDKNTFGRAAQDHFDEILELAVKGRDDFALYVGRRSFLLSNLPTVAEHVTEAFIESNARKAIAERAAVAASPVFAHEIYQDANNQTVMIIQHLASGLRARFSMLNGTGTVFSKPYSIESIDPDNPGTLGDWESYVGLGIGERIYAEAHRLAPDVRWVSGASSPYSTQLRQKLHATNPYIWSARCPWCEQNLEKFGISWDAATQEFFNDHP